VGQSLRRLREERRLSIRTLADASSLAANTLSLIENNKTSPSVCTLQQIAAALGVNITAFFEPQDNGTSVAYIRSNERLRMAFAHGTLEYLGTGLRGQPVQPCLVTLEPESDSSRTPIVHTGYEFVYGLSGRITYRVEDRTFLLEPGDSLLFESHLPHQWYNVSAELSQMLLVLMPTDEHDRPTEHHFAPTTLIGKSG
jgi:transcriptional regulator with XRE-family HTH domain